AVLETGFLDPRALVIEDAHVEAAGAARQRASDAAQTDDAERRAGHVAPEERRLRPARDPARRADVVVSLDDAPTRREQEGEREVRSGGVEHARRVRHRNAPRTA